MCICNSLTGATHTKRSSLIGNLRIASDTSSRFSVLFPPTSPVSEIISSRFTAIVHRTLLVSRCGNGLLETEMRFEGGDVPSHPDQTRVCDELRQGHRQCEWEFGVLRLSSFDEDNRQGCQQWSMVCWLNPPLQAHHQCAVIYPPVPPPPNVRSNTTALSKTGPVCNLWFHTGRFTTPTNTKTRFLTEQRGLSVGFSEASIPTIEAKRGR